MEKEYRYLRADLLIDTAERLASRIVGRFPQSSLGQVAVTIRDVTRAAIDRAETIRRPNWWLRIGLLLLVFVILAGCVAVAVQLRDTGTPLTRVLEFMRQTQGAAVYLTAAVVFFWTLEVRWKRARAVKSIHELRALAHIIDMDGYSLISLETVC